MSLNTGMLWLTPGRREEEGGRRGERREPHAVLAISRTLSYTHPQTPVTFDAVVVECFCHGGQSLLPRVTIGDQLGKWTKKFNVSFPPSISVHSDAQHVY